MPQLFFFGLKFADNIHYKFKSSQASKARLQSSKHTGTKQNLTQNGHSRSCISGSVERRQGADTIITLASFTKVPKTQRPKALQIEVFDYPTVAACLDIEKVDFCYLGSYISRSSKVIDFGTNRKCICNFVLVISSNSGPILPHFRDIAVFLLTRATPPLFHGTFVMFPLDQIADVVAPRSEDSKLSIPVINFELVRLKCPVCPRYINITDGWTDDLRQQYRALLYVRRAVKRCLNYRIRSCYILKQ